MATTTNFGWETPDDTDLVKDGAAAIRTALGGVDTSFVDLKGGTTGQILSKASNTDLDYTWITNDVGDITSVAAGTGLTGGGTSGAVTVSLDTASAYVLPSQTGNNGKYLTTNGTAASWGTIASGGDNWVLISGQSVSAVSSVSFTGLTGYKKLFLTCSNWWASANTVQVYLRLNADSGSNYVSGSIVKSTSSTRNQGGAATEIIANYFGGTQTGMDRMSLGITIDGCNGGGYKPYSFQATGYTGSAQSAFTGNGLYKSTSNISSINLTLGSGTISSSSGDGNEFQLWGVA